MRWFKRYLSKTDDEYKLIDRLMAIIDNVANNHVD